MKMLFILSAVAFSPMVSIAQTTQQSQSTKDTAVIQAPDGTKYEVKVPKKAIEEVKQTGPNSYDVKVNRQELKKIEVREVPKKK